MAEAQLGHRSSSKLGDRCIRLLHLSSAKGPLRGTLKTVSLDRSPAFAALSYTWGVDSANPLQHILCSGRTIPITQNCHDALSTLSSTFGVRVIWVDAICIKQDDDQEKGSQVPLMRDIYGRASRVYIWLGKGTKKSDEAIEWMRHASKDVSLLLGARFKPFPGIMEPRELSKVWRLLPVIMEKYLLKQGTSPEYNPTAVQDIVDRDWFGRMWTLQEVVMASEPVAVCGEKSLRWVDLSWALIKARELPQNRRNPAFGKAFNSIMTAELFWLRQTQKYIDTKGNVRSWVQGPVVLAWTWNQLLGLLEWRHSLVGKSQDFLIVAFIVVRFLLGLRPLNSLWLLFLILTRLLTRIITPQSPARIPGSLAPWESSLREGLPGVLNRVRSREAKLPVDKVFALYGIFEELEVPIQQPDYTKLSSQVYTEFTCDLITWLGNLDLLIEASQPAMPGAPSWVPDWTRTSSRVFRGDFKAAGSSSPSFRLINIPESEDYHSSVELEGQDWSIMDFRQDPNNLPCIITKGHIVDRVNSCIPSFLPEHDENGTSAAFATNVNILRQWLSPYHQSTKTKHTSNHFTETNLKILFNVIHSESWLAPEEKPDNYKLFPSWVNILSTGFDHSVDLETSKQAQDIHEQIQNSGLSQYHSERIAALADKRLLFSTQKSSLGMGSLAVRVGDVVALLAGFNYPMALRKVDESNKFEVIGISYVDGLMQGEGWEERDEKTEVLVLV